MYVALDKPVELKVDVLVDVVVEVVETDVMVVEEDVVVERNDVIVETEIAPAPITILVEAESTKGAPWYPFTNTE